MKCKDCPYWDRDWQACDGYGGIKRERKGGSKACKPMLEVARLRGAIHEAITWIRFDADCDRFSDHHADDHKCDGCKWLDDPVECDAKNILDRLKQALEVGDE